MKINKEIFFLKESNGFGKMSYIGIEKWRVDSSLLPVRWWSEKKLHSSNAIVIFFSSEEKFSFQ